MIVRVLDPTHELKAAGVQPAVRPSSLKGKTVGLLGLAFKPEVDDLRESPAIEVAHLLQAEGALVTAFEPYKPDGRLNGLTLSRTLEEALQKWFGILPCLRTKLPPAFVPSLEQSIMPTHAEFCTET